MKGKRRDSTDSNAHPEMNRIASVAVVPRFLL
jgi:hypothetical protein